MKTTRLSLLLDTSGSMHGEPIEANKKWLFQTLLTTLKQDHMLLETACMSLNCRLNCPSDRSSYGSPQFQFALLFCKRNHRFGEALS